MAEATGTRDYEISLAAPEHITDIVTLQDLNAIDHSGSLSVRLTADKIGGSAPTNRNRPGMGLA